jgi:uncharacterized protein YbcI
MINWEVIKMSMKITMRQYRLLKKRNKEDLTEDVRVELVKILQKNYHEIQCLFSVDAIKEIKDFLGYGGLK